MSFLLEKILDNLDHKSLISQILSSLVEQNGQQSFCVIFNFCLDHDDRLERNTPIFDQIVSVSARIDLLMFFRF